MLTLYRAPACPRCSGIQEVLEELAIAHQVVEVRTAADLPEDLRSAGAVPILLDGDEVFLGSDRILEHVEKLKDFKALWYKYQSDACYCDDQGNIE